MNDIQKMIDESRLSNRLKDSDSNWVKMNPETTHVFISSELKSLLEKIAKEQIEHDSMKVYEFASRFDDGSDLQDYVDTVTKDLTFNDD